MDASILIADTHIELCGNVIKTEPTIDQLANILGHGYRTIQHTASMSWHWDDLGIGADSPGITFDFPKSYPQHERRQQEVEKQKRRVANIHFILRPLLTDPNATHGVFPGRITAFGHRWTPGDDPHKFIRALFDSKHLAFKPYAPDPKPRGIHAFTEKLRSSAGVRIFDPSANPSVSDDGTLEIAIMYYFPTYLPQDLEDEQTVSKSTNAQAETPSPAKSPMFFESSASRVAQAETIRIFVRWFWRSGWRLLLLLIVGLVIWAYLSR